MFTKPIYDLQLAGETADRLFPNINASYAFDSSFLATLRVLLRNRISENTSVRLVCKQLNYTNNEISSAGTSTAMNWFMPEEVRYPDHNEDTVIIVYTSYQDAGQKMFEILRANAGQNKRYMGGYILQEDLRIFYARKLNALFYYSDVYNTTVIFTDKLELKQFHALQMMIPKYLPDLFKDNPLTDKETALLKSLGEKSAVTYERLIEEFTKELDIRSEIIRTKLAVFETAFERLKITKIQNEISAYERSYQNYLSEIRNLIKEIDKKKYTLAGLECAINERSGDSELMEYFMCNKNLSVIKVAGTTIEFVVNSYADIYNTEAFEQYVVNHRGYFYFNLNSEISKPQMERLYKAIFADNRYKLRMCAAYSFDMNNGMRALKSYVFPSESKTYLPNPHIQHYGCLGNYAMRFEEYVRSRDYIGGIEQAVMSARNLNFYDSTVIGTFASDLSYSTLTCIEKCDGTLLTPLQAIKELKGVEEDCQDPLF